MRQVRLIQRGLNWRPGEPMLVAVDEATDKALDGVQDIDCPTFWKTQPVGPGTITYTDGHTEAVEFTGMTFQD